MLSDNAPEFTGEIINNLCKFNDIKKCKTHPYKPSSNGAVERTNRRIKDVLKTVISPRTVDWDIVISDVQLTLNNTVNRSTGETPHFLLYGYQKRLPLILLDDARPPKTLLNYEDYASWRHKLAFDTMRQARSAIEHAEVNSKEYYNKKAVAPTARVGAQIYVQRQVPMGPNYKVSPKYEGPFWISKILPQNKFEITGEGNLEKRISHWNHMKFTTSDPWSRVLDEPDLEDTTERTEPNTTVNGDHSRQYPLRNRQHL